MMAIESAKTTDLVEVIEWGIDIDGSRWVLMVADILAPGLFDGEGGLTATARRAIAASVQCVPPEHVARTRLLIGDMHVLALVLPQTRTCRLYTPGAAQETFLLQLTHDASLQAHVDALRQHPPTFTTIDQVTAKYNLANLASPSASVAGHDRAALRTMIQQQVETMVQAIQAYRPPLLERVQEWFLRVTTEHPPLLHQVLRFVAVLPSLSFDRSYREMVRVLRENARLLLHTLTTRPEPHGRRDRLLALMARCVGLTARAFPPRLVGALTNGAVALIATRFIVPDTPTEVAACLEDLTRVGRDASLDQLGELVLTRQEADRYADAVIRLIDLAATQYGSSAGRRTVNGAGIPRAQVSVKLSALSTHFNPAAPQTTAEVMRPRLARILRHAKQRGAFICFDAEHYAYRDLSLHIPAFVLAATPDLDDFHDFGFVVQAYLQDAVSFAEQVTALARQRGHRIQVRLVKGAYWDAETTEAAADDVPAPTFWNKAETDLHFQQLVLYILERSDTFALAVASHNVREHAFAEIARSHLFPQAPVIEHQVLYRTAEGLARALTRVGWVTRDYVPVGDLLPGISYLVRRILENASQVGILAQSRAHLSADVIATDSALTFSELVADGTYAWDPALQVTDGSFRPSPPVRLHVPAEREAFATVLASTTVHTPYFATPADVGQMVQRAMQGGETWGVWPPEVRSTVLIRAAERMRAQRLALGALIVREGRKLWSEALADVDEAVDYLRFYARNAVHWQRVLGEQLQPVGVAAVIAPWNFPLAIPCGMTAAALAAGNAVLLKPAEQTPAIAAALVTLLHTAGVPPEALIFVPGDGQVGAALVADRQVDLVAFTGSWEVGAQIFYTSARVLTRQLRRVIAETGSKNPIVVTPTADMDSAIEGILRSAFGHAGQKCSACSRVLADTRLIPSLAERLGQAAEALRLGPAEDPATQLNPVITPAEAARLRAVAKRAAAEVQATGGRVVVDATASDAIADLVGPAIFLLRDGVDPAQVPSAREELFGPIVHIAPYTTPAQAIQFANGVPYALTAGIYAQSGADVELMARRLDAGNVYINRPITAARVGVEPFGGFKRSGTGPKAGSAEYLLAFFDIGPGDPPTAAALLEQLRRESRQALASRPSVAIPGQLNRLVYDRPLGRGLVLADGPTYFRHAAVVAALIAGNDVTVIVTHPEEAEVLRAMAALALAQEDVAAQLHVVEGTDAEALASVSAFNFVAGSAIALRTAAYAYAEHPREDQLPVFIGPHNGAPPDLPGDFIRRFVRPRLIAENTLRHGALISTGGRWE